MTTTGSALFLLNQFLNLSVSTSSSSVSFLPSSPSTFPPATPTFTSFPTSTATPTSTSFPTSTATPTSTSAPPFIPTLPSPLFLVSPEFETVIFLGFL